MAEESLRDAIEASFNTVMEGAESAPEPEPIAAEPEQPEAPAPAERPRDEQGRFVAAQPQEQPRAQPAQPPAQPQAATQQPATQQQAPAPAEQPQRPSSWKREHWAAYDKLAAENPDLAKYILQREAEYAKGVSTYKQEWDRAKPLLDAVAPYEGLLRQYNIDPAQHTARLFQAHQMLALGSPEQKLQMFAQLANDYKVPLGNLLYQGQDGQWYMHQPQAPAHMHMQSGLRPEDIDTRIKTVLEQQQIDSEISRFAQEHPHFDEVRETMSRLLDAGIAKDLEDAHAKALLLPEYRHLAPPPPPSQDQASRAQAARRNAVSPRSATPVAAAAPAGGKDLRSTIEAAFDARVAGRV